MLASFSFSTFVSLTVLLCIIKVCIANSFEALNFILV